MDYPTIEEIQQAATEQTAPPPPAPPSFLSKIISRIKNHMQSSKEEETRRRFLIPEVDMKQAQWGDDKVFERDKNPLVTNIKPKKPDVKVKRSIWSNKSPWSKK